MGFCVAGALRWMRKGRVGGGVVWGQCPAAGQEQLWCPQSPPELDVGSEKCFNQNTGAVARCGSFCFGFVRISWRFL